MASKRTSHEEGNDERDHQAPAGKRRSSQQQALYLTSVGSGNATNDTTLSLAEPLLRKMLQEIIPPIIENVMPTLLKHYLSPCCGLSLNRQQIGPSRGSTLRLCFMNRWRSKVFTMSKITAEDGSSLQIALCDTRFQQRRVKEDASSLRVQLCVLKGDFGANGSEDFTAEDFKANILGQREGKAPLLCGDTFVTLINGVGYVRNIVFTDNSSWTRSGLFRIGLKVCESTSNGADIMEGRSEPFKVMDKRGEAYEKRDRPSLNDDVWRLQKIAKNGKIRRQLSSVGIKTVKDMLRRYTINEASLRQSIGNIQGKPWGAIIEHAKTCEIDDHERYIYEYFAAEHLLVSLVFNCIYEVVEVSFNGQSFCSLESLNLEQERLVEIVKQQAYSNLKDLKPFEPTPPQMRTVATIQCVAAPDQDLQHFNFPIDQQDPFIDNFTGQQQEEEQTWANLCSTQPSTSTTTLNDEAALSDQACSSQLQDQFGEWSSYLADNEWAERVEFSTSCYNFTPPPPILWEQEDLFYNPYYEYGAESSKPVDTSTKEKAKTIWRKFRNVRNVLKWFAELAVQKKTKVFHHQD